jgi:uncharacterized C2H2 Zn-finger protein
MLSFHCNQCQIGFLSQCKLDVHQRLEGCGARCQEKAVSRRTRETVPPKVHRAPEECRSRLRCPHCRQSFARRRNVLRHVEKSCREVKDRKPALNSITAPKQGSVSTSPGRRRRIKDLCRTVKAKPSTRTEGVTAPNPWSTFAVSSSPQISEVISVVAARSAVGADSSPSTGWMA